MNNRGNIDPRTLELLNGGIDGELSTPEQAELDSLIAGSERVQEFDSELRNLTDLLDNVPEIDPPNYLQESIERQIRLPIKGEDLKDSADKDKSIFFGTWLPAHWMRTSFALAVGAVLTISVYEMGSKPMDADDATQMVGTMIKPVNVSQGALLDSIQISTETLTGSVELRNKDDLFTLDVKLNSDGPTQVVVNFANRGLTFEGVSRMQDSHDAVSFVAGAINITSSGEQRYTMSLRRLYEQQNQKIEPLELKFFANQQLVHEASLYIPQN